MIILKFWSWSKIVDNMTMTPRRGTNGQKIVVASPPPPPNSTSSFSVYFSTFEDTKTIFSLFFRSAMIVFDKTIFSALAIFTLKYLHVVQYNRQCSPAVTRINTAALITGYIAAFGIMVVGAFQVSFIMLI